MSRFHTDFAAVGLPNLLYQCGQEVVYSEPVTASTLSLAGAEAATLAELEALPLGDGDERVTLTALVDKEEVTVDETDRGLRRRRTRELTMLRDETNDYGGVADPVIAARMTVEEIEYAIEGIEWQTADATRVRLIRTGQVDRTRPGYRKGSDQ